MLATEPVKWLYSLIYTRHGFASLASVHAQPEPLTRALTSSADDPQALRQAYDSYALSREPQAFISLLNGDTQIPASWLLKYHLEQGERLSIQALDEVYRALPLLTLWPARLHFLQSMAYLPVPDAHKLSTYVFVKTHLTDENKFVRAWSYHGYYYLARQFPEYRSEFNDCAEMAMMDEAPSVLTRLRKLLKQGFDA